MGSYAVGRDLPVDAICRSLLVSMVDAAPNGGITVFRGFLRHQCPFHSDPLTLAYGNWSGF